MPEFETAADAESVKEFLTVLNLEHLCGALSAAGIVEVKQLWAIDAFALDNMQISAVGARRKLLRAVQVAQMRMGLLKREKISSTVDQPTVVPMEEHSTSDIHRGSNSTSSLYIGATVCNPDIVEVSCSRVFYPPNSFLA